MNRWNARGAAWKPSRPWANERRHSQFVSSSSRTLRGDWREPIPFAFLLKAAAEGQYHWSFVPQSEDDRRWGGIVIYGTM